MPIKSLLKSLLTVSLITCAAFLQAAANAPATAPSQVSIQYTKEHEKTAVEVIKQLQKRHYNKRRIDDLLSAQFLDNYLDALDINKSFLLQDDVKEFNKYRYELDDTFVKGDLAPGFFIFNRYQQRVVDRLNKIVNDLPEIIAKFDFSKEEYLILEDELRDWPVDRQQADDIWRKQIKNNVLSLKLAGKSDEDITKLLVKRYKNQLKRVEQYNAEDAFQIYVNALTELYDPHTNYLSPRISENFNINMSLSLEGIGAVLQIEDEFTKVVRLVHAGPADKQGELRPADKIVGVAQGRDGEVEDVVGWRLDEVVELIRGPKDTIVRLEVIPADAELSERKTIEIVRNTVKLEEQSAKKKVIEMLDGEKVIKVGVIDIPAFYVDFDAWRNGDPNFKSTTRDVTKLLDELLEEGVAGIVIDLRNNGGGSLQEANDLTGLFIEQGPIVQIRQSSNRLYQEGKRRKSPYYSGPLAVLINRLSASASEIFAGAIQDYQRGIIIGSQSFGKGTVQSLTQLQLGQLKITESKFYRVSGESTQHRGIIPDIEFPALYDKEKIGESSLEKALEWDQISSADYAHYYNIRASIPNLNERHLKRIATDPDFIYFQDRLAIAKKNSSLNEISLNEAQRKKMREENEQAFLQIENKRRQSKGLPVIDKLDESKSEEAEDAAEEDDDVAVEDDPILNEAAHILVDALPIYRLPGLAVVK